VNRASSIAHALESTATTDAPPPASIAHAAPPAPVPPRRAERAHHLAHHEEMERSVEEGEGRALAGAVERGSLREPIAALDVQRGERDERASHLGERQLREMPGLDRREPRAEPVLGGFLHRVIVAC
jgi:hypothetical protein